MIVYPTNWPVLLPRARVALLATVMLALAACSSGGNSGGGNTAPTANAGIDRTVTELTNVSLNGSGFDANGDVLTYLWTQTAGTSVTINNNTMAQANFDAFDVPSGAPETLSFQLVVNDGTVNASDVVDITIVEPAAMVAVSGTVSYEFVPANPSCRGLNFDPMAITDRPIRGATVQLLDAGGDVIGTTVSDDNGGYAFADVDANTMVRLRVRAELKKTTGQSRWDVDVRDNVDTKGNPPALGSRPLYVLDEPNFDTGSASVLTHDLTAPTGWGGASYTSARSAAPFAILDTIYTVIKFVEAADPDAFFAPLDAFWSIDNTATISGDINAGELGTSFYSGDIDSLFLLGDATDDTEEFDDHVIVHEWGHYFEDNFSRSDSFGGAHGVGDRLDARLAFGEGWATALSGMALGNQLYCDTGVPGTSGGFGIGTESGSWDARGWYDEISVIRFIYDMWDDNDDDGGGADTVSIGFTPIYNVMVGPQATTESFTTIFSFATALRASLNAGDQAGLDAQLAREDMTAAGLDIWGTNELNGAGAALGSPAPDVMPIYTDITADGTVLNICVNDQFDRSTDTDGNRDRYGNKLSEDRFLRISVAVTDQYDVAMITTTATPVTTDPDDRDQSDPDIYIFRGAQFIAAGTSPDENSETFTTTLQAGQTYIAAIEEWRFDDFEASPTYPERICFDISFSPTP